MTPTVVVGVGQAGINIINRIHDSNGLGWGSEYDEYFDYIAIDSSPIEVRNTPEKATQVHVQSPSHTKADQQAYPYLTESLQIGHLGAQRQRPVGRYKLDSGDSYEATVEAITETVEAWAETVRTSSDLPLELNIVHIHSLGGGTGSGTFPLIASIIDDIVAEVQPEYDINVYTAGIGVVPKIMHNLDAVSPPGDNRYYANAYAALKDLERLIDASPNDPLPIYLHSEFEATGDGTKSDIEALEPQKDLTSSPYHHYFLVDVDENQMARDDLEPEPYQDATNNVITAAIYGIAAQLGSGWLYQLIRGIPTKPRIGSFNQTQLSIPIQSVQTYCDLNDRIEELRGQVSRDDESGTLVKQLRDTQRQQAVLERAVHDPSATLRTCEQPEAVTDKIENTLDRTIGSEEVLTEATPGEIDQLINTIDEHHDEPVLLLALERADERLTAAEQRRKTALRELVDAEWQRIGDTENIDLEAQAMLERADALREYFRGEIERLDRKLAEDGPWFLPNLDMINLGPDHEQQRDDYQQRLDKLEEHRAAHRTVRETQQAIRDRREELLETRVEPELDRLEERISNQREALDRKEDDLRELTRDREDKVDEVTDAEFGSRIGLLALDEEKLREDLDCETLEEELTTLSAFHENGYLAPNLSEHIEERICQCYAWDTALMSWNDEARGSFGNNATTIRDIWMLHSDENTDLPEFDITGAGKYNFRRSDEGSVFPSFEDPYTIQFLSYTLDLPLTDLQIYTDLERAAEEGWLDAIIDVWDDYRLAFAYPEWYDREIQKVFDIETSTELPELPELDETEITVQKEGGELKSWISSHGLASYLWSGNEWDDFTGYISVEGYDHVGWKHYLSEEYGLSYDDMCAVVPSGRTAELWHAGEITWDDLLEEVRENLIKKHGIEIKLTRE